jgi:hypothetical protein
MRVHHWALGAVLTCFLVVPSHAVIVDDFEDGTLDPWQVTAADPINAQVTTASAHDGNYGVELGSLRTGWIFRTDAAAWVGWGDTFSAWTRVNYAANGRTYYGFGVPFEYRGYSAIVAHNTQEFIIQYNAALGSYENLVAVPYPVLLNHWYKVQVTWADGGEITATFFDSDGVTELATLNVIDNRITEGGMSMRSFGDVSSYFDTVERDGPTPTETTTWGQIKSLYW